MRNDKYYKVLRILLIVIMIINIIAIALFVSLYFAMADLSIMPSTNIKIIPIIILVINALGLIYVPVFIRYRKNK